MRVNSLSVFPIRDKLCIHYDVMSRSPRQNITCIGSMQGGGNTMGSTILFSSSMRASELIAQHHPSVESDSKAIRTA